LVWATALLSLSKVSSKGQVVIPKKVREKMGIVEGDMVLVYATGNVVVLRRVKESESVLSTVSSSVRRKVAEKAVRAEDVEEAIASVRKADAEGRS